MKKGLLSLLGIVAFLVIALVPATRFATTSTIAAKPHSIHIFPHQDHTPQGANASRVGNANGNVVYNGGPVMAGTTHIYAIFWEPTNNVSANYNALIERYFNDVGGSSLYKNNNQYVQTGGAFPSNAVLAASWVDTGAYPESPLLDSDIQNEVIHAQNVRSWSSGIEIFSLSSLREMKTFALTLHRHSARTIRSARIMALLASTTPFMLRCRMPQASVAILIPAPTTTTQTRPSM